MEDLKPIDPQQAHGVYDRYHALMADRETVRSLTSRDFHGDYEGHRVVLSSFIQLADLSFSAPKGSPDSQVAGLMTNSPLGWESIAPAYARARFILRVAGGGLATDDDRLGSATELVTAIQAVHSRGLYLPRLIYKDAFIFLIKLTEPAPYDPNIFRNQYHALHPARMDVLGRYVRTMPTLITDELVLSEEVPSRALARELLIEYSKFRDPHPFGRIRVWVRYFKSQLSDGFNPTIFEQDLAHIQEAERQKVMWELLGDLSLVSLAYKQQQRDRPESGRNKERAEEARQVEAAQAYLRARLNIKPYGRKV